MTADQAELIHQARNSVAAAQLLLDGSFPDYAAARAYYAMFYVAEAFLEGEGLSFSRHSAVIAAFGQNFARTGRVPPEYHRYLIQAQTLRHAGDYGQMHSVSPEQARQQIEVAAKFIALAEAELGSSPAGEPSSNLDEI